MIRIVALFIILHYLRDPSFPEGIYPILPYWWCPTSTCRIIADRSIVLSDSNLIKSDGHHRFDAFFFRIFIGSWLIITHATFMPWNFIVVVLHCGFVYVSQPVIVRRCKWKKVWSCVCCLAWESCVLNTPSAPANISAKLFSPFLKTSRTCKWLFVAL